MSDPNTSPTEQRVAGFRRGLFFTSFSTVISVASLFLESVAVARLVSTADFGIYVIVLAVVSFLAVIVDFGLGTAITKIIATSSPDRKSLVANSAMTFQIIVLLAVAAIIWLWRDILLVFDPTHELRTYSGYVPIMLAVFSFDDLFQGILQGMQLYRHMAIAQITRSGLRLVLTITFLVVFKLGMLALIFSWIISFAVSSFYMYIVMPVTKRIIFKRSLMAEILRFGFPLQLTSFLWFALRRLDVVLLGSLAGPTAVAYFAVASKIPEGLQKLSDSYVTVYFPTVASLLGGSRRDEAALMLNRSIRLVSFIGSLVALVSVMFSDFIVTFVFSGKYGFSSSTFAILMIAFHMGFVVNLLGYTLTADGRSGRSFGASLARAGLNLLADVILIPTYGFMGPALAQIISSYGTNPIVVWLLRRGSIDVRMQPYLMHALLLLLGALALWLLQPGVVLRLGFILVFVLVNLSLSTIQAEDWNLILPERLLSHLHGRFTLWRSRTSS